MKNRLEAEARAILLVANYNADRQFSMLRYSEMLSVALNDAGVRVRVWRPPVILSRLATPSSKVFKWFAYLDKFFLGTLLLFFVQFGWGRIHLCDHSNAIYRFFLWGRRVTVTCHDVIAIEAARGSGLWRVGFTGRIFQRLIYEGLRRCSSILCVSEHTKRQLIGLGGVQRSCVGVVYNPIDRCLLNACSEDVTPIWRELGKKLGDRYILHVGSDHPRKNRLGVVKIFAALVEYSGFRESKLLFVGPELSEYLRELLIDRGLLERVCTVSSLNEADLAAAYRGATCLLFPSYLEGFGWPIAEAQALGCPVFTSNIQPMPEIGGNGACYIDPDMHEMAAAEIAGADFLQMTKDGFESVRRFSLDNLADKVLGA